MRVDGLFIARAQVRNENANAGLMAHLNMETFLPDRIDRVAAEVNRWLAAIYHDEFDLSRPEWRVLAALGEDEPCNAMQVSALSRLHKTDVSRALSRLRKRRLVRRSTNMNDRREDVLALTASGRRYYERISMRMRDVERELVAVLGAGHAQALNATLATLESALVEE